MSASSRFGDDILTAGPQNAESSGAGLSLRAVGESLAVFFPLPKGGEVLIGRSADADVALDHPSISRRHALLRVGPALSIEDLGSANGTRVGGIPLGPGERRTLAVGEAIDLGSVLVVVQKAATSAAPRPHSHAVFERKLAEACQRAGALGGRLCVTRLHVGGSIVARAFEEELARAFDENAVTGAYAPGEYEVLFEGATPAEASERVDPLVEMLRARGADVRFGAAGFPRDGRTAEALIAKACADLRGPSEARERPVFGASTKMQELERLIDRIAPGNISVLLLGETGVGKEVTAAVLHQRSRRADKPFVKLNCGALSESLLESELFGHERGAFTGAVQAKRGLLETARGGTVLFDEIGELTPAIQIKLLRVLEEQAVLPVGGLSPRPIDVRFIAATNRDLEREVERGTFRQDLFFRLSGATLSIPPLRERTAEIEPLATLFVERAAKDLGTSVPRITEAALELLTNHRWPGNVRELRNVMERAVLLAAGEAAIDVEHLPADKILAASDQAPRSMRLPATAPDPDPTGAGGEEKERILEALARCAGNQTKAAELLGISRGTLLVRLEEFRIPRPRKKRR